MSRNFNQVLQDQRNGNLIQELTEKLAKVIAGVQETDKVGTLNLKLTIRPRAGTGGTQIEVSDQTTLKIPERSTPSTLFYIDGNHQPVREDPNQHKIKGLEVVDAEKKRDVS